MTSSTADVLHQRAALRRCNLDPAPQRSAFAARSSGLKFDLKKATALAKRFKNYSAEASESFILSMLDSVGFGMFLSEAAHAVVQSLCHGTKMKPADARSFAVVCSEVHQRYEEFWPLVKRELKENVGSIFDTGTIKTAIGHIGEYTTTTTATAMMTSGGGDGNTPPVTTLPLQGSSSSQTAAALNNSTMSSTKSPVEELNRLRLVARVFCEWWLVGLFEEAKPVLNLLRLFLGLIETKKGTPNTPLTVAMVLSISALIIREIGIEMLGKDNGVISTLFNEKDGNDKNKESLRDLIGHSGMLASDKNNNREGNGTLLFLLGPVGARLSFNTTTKAVVPVEDAVAQQAEEASWGRICEARDLPTTHYSTDEEKRQFSVLALASARLCLKTYEERKEEVEKWWQSLHHQTGLRGKTAQLNAEETQFRLLQEHVERVYVVCDNLLGMLGFVSPPPIDLLIVEQKENVETVRISVNKKYHPIVGAETLNRFGDDDQRIFYEYVPEIDAFMDDTFLASLIAEKANWDLFSRHRIVGGGGVGATTAALAASTESDGGNGENDAVDSEHFDTMAETAEGRKKQLSAEPAISLIEKRQLWLAELGVPAARFEEYADVMKLLEELVRCSSAPAVDEWCERFVGEALRPLRQSPENVVSARLFFTNCRMLVTLELQHYPRFNHPENLPFMARCAAIFQQFFPDIGAHLSKNLEAQWRREYTSQASTTESEASCNSAKGALLHCRMTSTVRYLCELMKFGVIPSNKVMNIIKVCMENLKQKYNAATISAIFECCGLFLIRSRETRREAGSLVQKIKNNVQSNDNINEEWAQIITKAFVFLNPPAPPPLSTASNSHNTEKQTPMEKYIRYLLHESFSPGNYNFVRMQLFKMPLRSIEGKDDILMRTLRRVHQTSWDNVPLLADLLAEFVHAGHVKLVQRILDEIAEDMRRDLEVQGKRVEHTSNGKYGTMTMTMTSVPQLTYRPLQWRLVDCFFIANLYRVRVLSLRFVAYTLLMQLLYFPGSSCSHSRKDYSRLQYSITLLLECVPSFPWVSNFCAKGFGRLRARTTREMDRLASLHQILRKLMALVFTYRYDLVEPLPLLLQLRLRDLMETLEARMRLDEERRDAWNETRTVRGSEEKAPLRMEDAGEKCSSQPRGSLSRRLTWPESSEAAQDFAKAVAEETVLPSNAWYEKMYEAVKGGCRNGRPFSCIFTVGDPDEPLACTSEILPAEITDTEGTRHASLDLMPDDIEEQVDVVLSQDESDATENGTPIHGTVTAINASNSIGSVSSCTSLNNDCERVDDDDGDIPSSLSGSLSETTTTEDEEDDDEDEEDEDEEEEVEEDEEVEEEEEEEEEGDILFAAAEELRLQLEKADLDAELHALMSETHRGSIAHATVSANVKGNATGRLIEQDLALGIRMHRQQQRQGVQTASSLLRPPPHEKEEKEEGKQEVRFTLLRRPPHTTLTSGKTGNTASAAMVTNNTTATIGTRATTTTDAASANRANRNNFAVLSVSHDAMFAKSAMMSQELYRKQQEQLREVTLRINRMQEEEGSSKITRSRESR